MREFQQADARGVEVERLRDERARVSPSAISRRGVLAGGAAIAAASLIPMRRAMAASAAPKIAIIGGGMAGLTTALTLADAGLPSTIYEALPNRVGGRMLTDRSDASRASACGTCHTSSSAKSQGTWLDGQETDVFGEMIDTGHKTMLSLASRFGLPLIDLLAAQPSGSTDTFYFNGGYYSAADAERDYKAVLPALKADITAAGYPTSYDWSKPGGRALDAMSIYDWIETRVPGGHRSPFGKLLDAAYNIEFGAETTDQSSLNLLYLLGYGSKNSFSVFGPSDERYRIRGGIDLLPAAIANALGSSATIRLGAPLTSIAQLSDGRYQLSFDGRSTPETADIVVLTLPFAVLRGLDFSRAGFDALKVRAITEQGAGKNGKLQLQFHGRPWAGAGPWGLGNGNTYSDTGYQCTWEATRGQPGASGILVNYTGGLAAEAMRLRHPYGDWTKQTVLTDADTFLNQIEPVFPGLRSQWTGRAASAMPHTSPYWKCSYSYWRVGQMQTFAGYERVRQGNVFFAGEHTSLDFQGWMEGAASEGVRAGNEILASMRGKKAG